MVQVIDDMVYIIGKMVQVCDEMVHYVSEMVPIFWHVKTLDVSYYCKRIIGVCPNNCIPLSSDTIS